MTVDREQVRRDAEELLAVNSEGAIDDFGFDETRFARACLALLAKLEQAERNRDRAERQAGLNADLATEQIERAESLEARLAAVPALVEAMRYIAGYDIVGMEPHLAEQVVAREALAAYEEAQK